jgi:hypothetical protein
MGKGRAVAIELNDAVRRELTALTRKHGRRRPWPSGRALCRRRLAATVIVECALQRSLGPNNNLAVYLSQRINAFSPLPFNAAVDAQRIYGTH